jgi:hypothetical protein
MGRITRRQLTDLLGALGVVATLAGLAIGLPLLDDALPADRPVRTDEPYPIGGGVTVVLPRDAVLDVTGTRPGDTAGTALFRIGPVRYAIAVQPFDGTLEAAANRMRQRITGTPGYQVTGGELTITTGSGLAGRQGGYTAPGRGGRYTVFLAGDLTIEVTVSGSELDLGRTLPEIEASTRTLRTSAAR